MTVSAMRKIKKIGIEAEFSLILSAFLAIMVISQSILVIYMEKNIAEQRQMSRDVVTRQVNSFLTMKIEILNRIRYEVQADSLVAEILEQKNDAEQRKLIERYTERMYEIQNYFSDIFYVVTRDEAGRFSRLTPNISASEYERLQTVLGEPFSANETEVSLFDIDGNAYSDYRYIFIDIPVNRYDFSLCKNISVGNAAICMKVNMRDAFSSDRFSGQYENINLSICTNGKKINLINTKGNKSRLIQISDFYITNTSWELVGYVNDHTHNTLLFIRALAYASIALTVLLMILFRWITVNEILKPISKVRDYLAKHSLNERAEKLELDGNRDICELVSSINAMYEQMRSDAHKIFYNQQESYEREILNVETQLRLLQNQVNPHFIYNTFETIRSIADYYNAKEICVIIHAMNGLLRYNLNSESKVKIADEIDIIKKYIEIMKIRYDNSFTFSCECSEGAEGHAVLRMVCQPLIENCFVHGFRAGGTILNISMSVTETDSSVIISIKDDGRGIPTQKRIELSKNYDGYEGNEVGIRNLIYRLRLCYNNNFDFQILSEENAYTIINVRIPREDNN